MPGTAGWYVDVKLKREQAARMRQTAPWISVVEQREKLLRDAADLEREADSLEKHGKSDE